VINENHILFLWRDAAHLTVRCDPRHRFTADRIADWKCVTARRGDVMVAKCSNPSCSASFRSLKEGRLFRLESEQPLRSSNTATGEYFWLCSCCSSTMTLHLSDHGCVIPVALLELPHNSGDFISGNRQSGLVLSDVRFSLERHQAGAGSVG